ncbi:hypothetical protein HBI72_123060 [Parastagonospora nodorum]|nr:hypothetical protein HBI72_123060 [Parastagonospora nodorum]
MHDPPGTIPPEAARLHPRRIPAHRSVSLRHSPPASRVDNKVAVERQATALSSPNAASDKANPPSVSPHLQSNKYSSGESSDAGRWFEITNNNARQSGASAVDNDPPFFLRNSSSSETPPEGLSANSAHYPRVHPNMPYRPTAQIGNDGSSTEDFRSVIDDLTIANKKLKQKLKKYEQSHDARLEEDKLFEVRFHGLPDHKKKELEETLRKFAAGLDDATSDYPPITQYPPTLDQQKTQSSTSHFNESGYASMSASGQNSSAVSNQASNQANDSHKMSRSAYKQQQQSIQSYLHDVHGSLLPQNNVPMTDKSKKKMVVRRLEQIFAGKVSVPGSHPQPMQQEEVAQSAATADREEREATGRTFKPEGLRVARILSGGRDTSTPDSRETLEGSQSNVNIGEQDCAGSGSPDQRPTRPLDLDLLRAQVPGENMEYIRHLGFTPPDMETGDKPEEGHGWLYLNLLINMAQLHTLNVTPEFVKDALNDYSGHLELSSDGRKIRWKGGLDMTKGISDSSSENLSGGSPAEGGSPIKRQRTDDSRENDEDAGSRARKIARATRERELEKFAYKPMFFKRVESEDDDDSYGYDIESSGASMQRPHHAGDSSGFGSSAMQSHSSTKNRREDGPLIFYTKAKFCTDLSGDRLGTSLMPGSYQPVTSQPLGVTSQDAVGVQHRSGLTEPRGPMDVSPMELDSNATVSSEEYFGFSPAFLRNDTSGSGSPAELMDFEASGLGGVRPEDNFAIRVRRSQTQTVPIALTGRRRSNVYSKRILRALGKESSADTSPTSPTSPQRVIKSDIISASRKTLPNSELPPASYLPFDSTSSGDVDSDSDSGSDADESSEADSESGEGPATAMQMMNMSTSHHDSGDSGSEASQYSEDTDDDGSVDFLATARQLDPNTILNQEREYDAAVADRLAEEIVAGSSAATAGGGSGFNTPAAGLRREDSARKQRASTSGSLSSRSKLKRSRTSDGRMKKSKNQKTSD